MNRLTFNNQIILGPTLTPMEDIRYKINVVAAIAAVGAIMALVGTILAWNQFPKCVGILDLIIFGLLSFVAVMSIKPTTKQTSAIWNMALGVLGIIVTTINYLRIAGEVEAETFMDVGIGIWIAFAGVILFTIFSISDFMYKRKNQ